MPLNSVLTDNFITWEAIGTNVATLSFPLAGVIPALKSFYFDDEQRKIITTFGFIFSAAAVLYCHSEGINLVNAFPWSWSFVAAFLLWLAYFAMLTFFKAKQFPQNFSPRAHTGVILTSACLFIGFFVLLSYSFNNLALLKFSHFTLSGSVYVTDTQSGVPKAQPRVEVRLEGSRGFRRETATDDKGIYQFTLNLSQLFLTNNLRASDPTRRHKESVRSLTSQGDNLQLNFFLEPQNPGGRK